MQCGTLVWSWSWLDLALPRSWSCLDLDPSKSWSWYTVALVLSWSRFRWCWLQHWLFDHFSDSLKPTVWQWNPNAVVRVSRNSASLPISLFNSLHFCLISCAQPRPSHPGEAITVCCYCSIFITVTFLLFFCYSWLFILHIIFAKLVLF